MNSTKSSQIIFDHVWQPLVHVPAGHRAFLLHPGTTIKPRELTTGWYWHWPWLTSICHVAATPIPFHFTNQNRRSPYTDEPITAVSHDHHLFTSQGTIVIGINLAAPTTTLSRLNRHTLQRVIRPLVRQSVRQTIALFQANTLLTRDLAEDLMVASRPLFDQHGLVVHQAEFTALEYYQPPLTH